MKLAESIGLNFGFRIADFKIQNTITNDFNDLND